MTNAQYAKQLGAYGVLVVVQTFALLLYKLCQQNGTYTFNPASSVALTEICKLLISLSLHAHHTYTRRSPLFENVNAQIVLHYIGLSTLYTINNQLTFHCMEFADPGSIVLGKSTTPYLCAVILRFTGMRMNELHWVCIIIQCCAIAIVQYDACQSVGILPTKAYGLIAASICITAITSVWNQLIIKGSEVPMHLQNTFLYSFVTIVAIVSYASSTLVHERHSTIGLFEGYTSLALALVLFQAFHGLAVVFVFKYADAIVKNFANSTVVAVLVILSYLYFSMQTTVHSWLGIVIILVTTYTYMTNALRTQTPTALDVSVEKARLLDENKDVSALEAHQKNSGK